MNLQHFSQTGLFSGGMMAMFEDQMKAMRVKNFRIFFFSQLVSQSGSWMQAMVESWLVFRLTHSPFWLGAVTFTYGITSFLCTPLAGVIGDRFNRKSLLLAVELICMVQAAILTILVATNTVQIWHIMILTVMLGAGFGFELTLRISLISDLVEDEYLPSAIRLSSMGNYAGRIIGPAIGGVLMELAGEAACFGVNALTFLVVVIGLIFIKEKLAPPKASKKTIFGDIQEGMKYVANSTSLFSAFALASVIMLVGYTYSVLFPLIAKDVLSGGTREFSILVTCFGIGGTIGAFTVKMSDDPRVRNLGLTFRLIAVGAFLVMIAYSKYLLLSGALSLLFGWAFLGTNPTVLGLIQTSAEKSIRSRVNSLYFMVMLGAAPIGGFVSGIIAGAVGVQLATVALALICVIWAALSYLKLAQRPRNSVEAQ